MQPGINEIDLLNQELEPDVFIVDGILPTGVTLLCGTQKIGKSWWALKLCLCASRGVDFWRRKTLHCKALYCCLEDPKKRIRKRYEVLINAAEEFQGTAPSGWLDFRFELPKLNEGLVEELESYVSTNPECKLIVIDTLLLITPPMNDAPYANDYNNIIALKKFADRHEIAVVLIHHTRKLKAKDPFQEILGTSGLNGAADTMMILSREERGDSMGSLKYTGRDIEDEEISLEFSSGDWRIAQEDTPEDDELPLMQNVIDLVGNRSQWQGSASDFVKATGCELTNESVTKALKKNSHELEQRGFSFSMNQRSGKKRGFTISNRNSEK